MTAKDLQEAFIEELVQNKTPVSIFLKNGVQLKGIISRHGKHCIELQQKNTQLIYKHTIATILPARNARY